MSLSSLKDFPDKPHWVIMTTSSTYVPGDERSRTNPGHGYHEHWKTSVNYKIYLDKNEWEIEIDRREKSTYASDGDYVAFKSSGRAKINKTISVTVDDI